ncbi:hypothetical protein TB2_027164 [Malus domestica]
MRIYNSDKSESKYLQNDPPDIIPQEDRAVKHMLDSLLPISTTTGGGPLVINHEPTSSAEATSLWSTQELFQGRSFFIANEENSSISRVGVDALVKDGLVSMLRDGPLFWIDMADKQPCIGTGGMIPWKLHVTGKLFHNGLAHKLLNNNGLCDHTVGAYIPYRRDRVKVESDLGSRVATFCFAVIL